MTENAESTPQGNPPTTTEMQMRNVQASLSYIEKAKLQVKADVEEVRTTNVEFAQIKEDSLAKKRTLKATETSLQNTIQKLTTKTQKLKSISSDLEVQQGTVASTLKSVSDNAASVEENKKSIDESKNLIDEQAEAWEAQYSKVIEQATEFEELYNKTLSYGQKLFDDREDEEGNQLKSVKTQIDETLLGSQAELSAITATHEDLKDDFIKLREELEGKILDLLPKASAASLAHTFVEAKEKHNNPYARAFYYLLFMAPLIAVGLYFMLNLDFSSVTLKEVFARLVVSSPFFIISGVGLVKLKQQDALYDAYAHKQQVMESYHGFERAVEKEGHEQQKADLIGVMLDTVKDKSFLKQAKEQKEKIVNMARKSQKAVSEEEMAS